MQLENIEFIFVTFLVVKRAPKFKFTRAEQDWKILFIEVICVVSKLGPKLMEVNLVQP